jgi:inorganic pyrophosphatase
VDIGYAVRIMKMPPLNAISDRFWKALDQLVEAAYIVIDRPAGTEHPRYHGFIYPLNYGYLEGTKAVDSGGVDVWVGSQPREITGIVLTVDLLKKDAEVKILVGCSPDEMRTIEAVHNEKSQSGVLIRRSPGDMR